MPAIYECGNEAKPDDQVLCVDSGVPELETGEKYVVTRVESELQLIGVDGGAPQWHPTRFRLIERNHSTARSVRESINLDVFLGIIPGERWPR